MAERTSGAACLIQTPILAPLGIEYNTAGEEMIMGAFLFGFICGVGATIFIFLYDEGEMFLKLANRVRMVTARYRQQRAG